MHKTNVHLTDKHYYECEYCHEEYIPIRRYVQKFCSSSCRSKAHHRKNRVIAAQESSRITGTKRTDITPQSKIKKKGTKKQEKMSVVGVANAAMGTLAVDTVRNIFTKPEDMPATKGDLLAIWERQEVNSLMNKMEIRALAPKLERYQRISNRPENLEGKLPYFDMVTKQVVYLFPENASYVKRA